MHGEAFAYAKYTDFATIAQNAGLTDVATLFTTTAATEKGEHFAEEAKYAGLVSSTAANLQNAIDGENYETLVMYPGFAAAASRPADQVAADLFTDIGGDEAMHSANYQAALDVVKGVSGATMPKNPQADTVGVAPGPAEVSGKTTLDDLTSAMQGEAFAYVKYMMFSGQAGNVNNMPVAGLFDATAQVERYEHFREEAQVAGLFGTTAANLANAIAGETYENTQMYPGFAATATAEGCTAVAALFTDTAGDEGRHAAAYTAALKGLTAAAAATTAPTTKAPATTNAKGASVATGGYAVTDDSTPAALIAAALLLGTSLVLVRQWRRPRVQRIQ
jgi:rubrerythrin